MVVFREPTNPSMRVVYEGEERRLGPQPISLWQHAAMIAGVVAAMMAAAGAALSFLKPSLVASLDVESTEAAKIEHARLDARIDQFEDAVVSVGKKLDDLPERITARMRRDGGHGH